MLSLADLNDLYKVLYVLYRAHQINRSITIRDLLRALPYMHGVGHLRPALSYLRKNGYIEGPDLNLWISGKGLQTIVTFFRKLITYLKTHRNDELTTWINSLDLNRNNIDALIRDANTYIQTQTPVTNAFNDFIDEVGSIENVTNIEIHEVNFGVLIDKIFLNIHDINMLFEQRFSHKLFCQDRANITVWSLPRTIILSLSKLL